MPSWTIWRCFLYIALISDFPALLWKVYFFGIVKHTYKNNKIKLHCPQESYLKSFWDSWMFLMCTLRWWKWENDYPQESHWICYIKIFTKVTNISNVTHVENHWHQLVIWENTSKSFTKSIKITNVIVVENPSLKQKVWRNTSTQFTKDK